MSLFLATRGYAMATVQVTGPSGIVSITQTPVGRMTPVVARVTLGEGSLPWIIMSGGQYDERLIFYPTRPIQTNQSGDQRWTPSFRDKSSVVADGDDLIISILPNGGWWRESFRLIFVAGTEMTKGV